MAAYLSRRLASGVLLILALTLLTYVVFFTIPTNPACNVLDCGPQNHTTPAEFAAAKHALGLDRSFLHQYGDFLWNLVRHGSLGKSLTTQFSVGSALKATVPPTASILLGGALLLVLLALPLGTISALRPHGLLDRAVLVVSLVGIALHPFVLGLLLQKLAGRLGIGSPFPYCPLHGSSSSGFAFASSCGGPLDWAFALYLPWIVFAAFFLPLYTRMFRARVLATLGEPYVRTARAKGASQLRVLSRHVLRNAALPVLPMLAMDVGTAITTAIYIEVIFRINGLGRLAVDALSGASGGYDLPSIVGIVFVVACAVVVLNLLADVALVVLDPRITGRSGSRSPWRAEDGSLSRRRVATAVAATALVVGGVAAAAIVPRGGAAKPSLASYTSGAKQISDHWSDRMVLGGVEDVHVQIEKIVVGANGWAVTASVEANFGQDLTVIPGRGNYPPEAGFSLQFATKDARGKPAYTALPALAYDPPLPSTLPVGQPWEGTFAGPGELPHDGTMIFVGFGLFSIPTDPLPRTLVTNSSFKLH